MCFEARTCFDLPTVSQISEEYRNLKEGWSQGCEQPKDKKTFPVLQYSFWQKEIRRRNMVLDDANNDTREPFVTSMGWLFTNFC